MSEAVLYQVGTRLAGRFELMEILGQGTSGVVYRAVDHEMFGQVVAVKVLFPHLLERPEVIDRFRNEVRIARELAHPHIVRFFEWCTTRENGYLVVMELVSGTLLQTYLEQHQEQRLPIKDATRILYETASALRAAHQKGIVHRDLKPENLILDRTGHVKVLDFGIARLLDDEQGLSETGESMGTPYYMSPEQFRGEAPDPRSDIYSLGILAYQLVTGRLPFTAEVFYELAIQHLTEHIPPFPPEADVPQWLQDVITHATSKSIEERTQSASEIAAELAAHLEENQRQGYEKFNLTWRAAEERRKVLWKKRRLRRWAALFLTSVVGAVTAYVSFCFVNVQQWGFLLDFTYRIERVTGEPILKPFKALMGMDYALADPNALERAYQSFLGKNSGLWRGDRAETVLHSLYRAGADPNIDVSYAERTEPLAFWLVIHGPTRVLLFFMGDRFNPNVRNSLGQTFGSVVTVMKQDSVLQKLFQLEEFDPTLRNTIGGTTILHDAAFTYYPRGAEIIVDGFNRRGLSPNIKNADGFTALEVLLKTKAGVPQQQVLEQLLRAENLDLSSTGTDDKPPIELAATYATREIIHMLLKTMIARRSKRPAVFYPVEKLLRDKHFDAELALWHTLLTHPQKPSV